MLAPSPNAAVHLMSFISTCIPHLVPCTVKWRPASVQPPETSKDLQTAVGSWWVHFCGVRWVHFCNLRGQWEGGSFKGLPGCLISLKTNLKPPRRLWVGHLPPKSVHFARSRGQRMPPNRARKGQVAWALKTNLRTTHPYRQTVCIHKTEISSTSRNSWPTECRCRQPPSKAGQVRVPPVRRSKLVS